MKLKMVSIVCVVLFSVCLISSSGTDVIDENKEIVALTKDDSEDFTAHSWCNDISKRFVKNVFEANPNADFEQVFEAQVFVYQLCMMYESGYQIGNVN